MLAYLPDLLSAQTCLHTGLSKKFDFKITRVDIRKPNDTSLFGEKRISVEIYNKSDKRSFQSISFKSGELYDDFKNCINDRSLITGKNKDAEVGDNDYGDIIVADVNFDGIEDLAIKDRWIGNIGAGYRFYLQTPQGFKQNKYLTEEVVFFPWLLKPKSHLLITTVSPTPGTTIRTYGYNAINKKWRKVGERFVYHDTNIDNILKKLKK